MSRTFSRFVHRKIAPDTQKACETPVCRSDQRDCPDRRVIEWTREVGSGSIAPISRCLEFGPLTLQKRRQSGHRALRMSAITGNRRTSFDHLIGAAEQRERDGETEHLRGLEVDEQLDLRGLNDRQVGRLVAFENPAGVDAGLTV
jgi:hypothetical protein